MKQSVWKDGYKEVRCGNCWKHIGKQYFEEKNSRDIKCKYCKTINHLPPTKRVVKDGALWIEFGVNGGLWTAI